MVMIAKLLVSMRPTCGQTAGSMLNWQYCLQDACRCTLALNIFQESVTVGTADKHQRSGVKVCSPGCPLWWLLSSLSTWTMLRQKKTRAAFRMVWSHLGSGARVVPLQTQHTPDQGWAQPWHWASALCTGSLWRIEECV